jgi:hypothetical protein
MTTSIRDNLIAARALIDTPEKWHKGSMRHNGCLCAMGAVADALRATGYNGWIRDTYEFRELKRALPSGIGDVPVFNDLPTTTHADVLALFDRAISNTLPIQENIAMAETAHTPGPWGVKFDDFDDAWHVTPDGLPAPKFGEWSPICVLGSYEDNEEANARLIAAAPTMLEALKAVPDPADFASSDEYREAVNRWWVDVAQPALSLATGATNA